MLANLEIICMGPVRDPISNLVYRATDYDVDRVIINGKTVVEEGELFGMDAKIIAEEFQRIGDPFIDAIPSRNKEGKTAEDISTQSF